MPSVAHAPRGAYVHPDEPTFRVGQLDEMIHEMLVEYNKYHPGSNSPFVKGGGKDGEMSIGGLYSLQAGNWGVFDKDADKISVSDLRKAALETLYRAQSVSAGDAETAAEGVFDGGHPFAAGAIGLWGTPHGTQTGPNFFTPAQAWTVPVNTLRIRHQSAVEKFGADLARGADDIIAVMSHARGDGSEPKIPGGKLNNADNSASSYGTMTSPSEPFGGFAPWAHVMPLLVNLLILKRASAKAGG